jgi:hypothetical protein
VDRDQCKILNTDANLNRAAGFANAAFDNALARCSANPTWKKHDDAVRAQ